MRIALETGTMANEAGDYMLEDGLVCFRRWVWIPDNVRLKLQVAHECHKSKSSWTLRKRQDPGTYEMKLLLAKHGGLGMQLCYDMCLLPMQ